HLDKDVLYQVVRIIMVDDQTPDMPVDLLLIFFQQRGKSLVASARIGEFLQYLGIFHHVPASLVSYDCLRLMTRWAAATILAAFSPYFSISWAGVPLSPKL